MTEDSSRAEWLQQARSYLRNADPVLARLIDDRPAFDPRVWMAQLPPMDLYGALLFQVTGQQLSVPATRRILGRIEALFGGHLLGRFDARQRRRATRIEICSCVRQGKTACGAPKEKHAHIFFKQGYKLAHDRC